MWESNEADVISLNQRKVGSRFMFLEFKEIAKQKFVAQKKKYFSDYPDIFTKMYDFTRAKTARALGYYPYFPQIEESESTEVVIDRKST